MNRKEYELSDEDYRRLLDACKPVPLIMIGNTLPPSQQENANLAWHEIGVRMGFRYMTVKPVKGKSDRFFTAVPFKRGNK